METKISTKHVLKILYILSWIIFPFLCVDAGTYLFSAGYTHFINHNNADYWGLSVLYRFDSGYFAAEILLITIPLVLKAIMFYLIIKILHDKKLDMDNPFNEALQRFTLMISILAAGIGLFTMAAVNYTEWLRASVMMPEPGKLHLEGADIWLFMSAILFIIAQIFKRGVEIQTENQYTI
ncbi:DUF2975 domain-containing protein [Flavobacterium pallidum]|uniref:DUF2975 domain-containing protein n=1 Tax=Flavobacterium pallidum TaxID=2172098 RepID=A0A2S1SIJ4_9FLAO|nr:DUF2975 domain-containing protein [Flavobacterium pallidum]AWI26228.1 hypothetical protein HYN49_10125 [Flavobacterium pallidum]